MKRCTEKNKRKAEESGGERADRVRFEDSGTEEQKEAAALETVGLLLGATRVERKL